jgi:hypothetical protein
MKDINFKETFTILHAFVPWYEQWTAGRVRLACDNSAVVDGIKKHSIDGHAIRPLQTILLIAALFDIDLPVRRLGTIRREHRRGRCLAP